MSPASGQIEKNLSKIRDELGGRAKLLAVSKTRPSKDVLFAYQAGQRDFGENKVQELQAKAAELEASCPEIRWHFIGKLQSNKINALLKVPNLASIHSIDSIKLLNKLLSRPFDTKLGLFLQYNASGEREKSGFENYRDLREAAARLKDSPDYRLQGLMTMGAIRTENFELDALKCFDELAKLRDRLEKDEGLGGLELSMGMSADYRVALERGSDWVRIGSGIFGPRKP